MTRRGDRVSMQQMLDHTREAADLAHGRTREDLDAERLFFLALLKLVEIDGEAAMRVSEDLRRKHCEIPWRQIIGTRNRLVHGYDDVDRDILWEIVSTDFPSLAPALDSIVDALPPDVSQDAR